MPVSNDQHAEQHGPWQSGGNKGNWSNPQPMERDKGVLHPGLPDDLSVFALISLCVTSYTVLGLLPEVEESAKEGGLQLASVI